MNFLPKLESFEGPMDLLLHLIDKNKIDIYDIPIAEITDQYIEYLDGADETDADLLSEFLVMAATLLEIKARMLLPAPEEEEDEEDPRQALVERLLEYKLCRYMAKELKGKEREASKNLYRTADVPDEVKAFAVPVDYDILLEDITSAELSQAFSSIMQRYALSENEEAKRYGKIKKEEISLPERMQQLRFIISEKKTTDFITLIKEKPTRDNIIVTFLAVLELMRAGQVFARQNKGNIELKWTDKETKMSSALETDSL